LSARRPKDEEEFFKALLAIENGRGKSIAEVIEEITGGPPSQETIDAVRNRLHLAQENGEPVDIAAIVESLNTLMNKWA
jgi:hypothetical protein